MKWKSQCISRCLLRFERFTKRTMLNGVFTMLLFFFQVERSRKERSAHHDEKEKSIYWSTNQHCESHRVSPATSPKTADFVFFLHRTLYLFRRAGFRFLLCFENQDGVEQVFFHSDVTHFTMATSVRWFGMLSPDLKVAKKLKIFSANPLVFDAKQSGTSAQDLTSDSTLKQSNLIAQEYYFPFMFQSLQTLTPS